MPDYCPRQAPAALLETYVSEWETVKASIATGLLNKCGNLQEPDS